MILPVSSSPKYKIVKIVGEEGKYFVLDVIEGLWDKKALVKPIDSNKQHFLRVAVERLEVVPVPLRTPFDFFLKLVVQGLKFNIEQMQTTFHCNTIFKAYQFRPLLKYLANHSRRLLIADETGLGKTIETGYILVNELCSGSLGRVIILCPANLKYKWQGELWHRFGLYFDIVSGRTLLSSLLDERRKFHFITSIDCLRSMGKIGLAKISSDKGIDLLIIDEIHHMIGRGGDILRRRLGISLSLLSRSVVGLTATPVHLEMNDLKRIIDVIRPGAITNQEFDVGIWVSSHLNSLYKLLRKHDWSDSDSVTFQNELKHFYSELNSKKYLSNLIDIRYLLRDIQNKTALSLKDKKERYKISKKIKEKNLLSGFMTRTRRIEVGEVRKRNIQTLKLTLDKNLLEAFQNGRIIRVSEKSLFQEIDEFLRHSFSHVHRQQLYSCLPAMIGLLRNGMRGFNFWCGDKWEELETKLTDEEINRCEDLANKFGLLKKDSKWEKLKKLIIELHEQDFARKIIVFTQWIPTIEYIRKRKHETGFRCYVVSGKDSQQSRNNSLISFRKDKGFAILFTTDVLSEGLDLQSANCIINYDLPFNPQKIEQRIGRIDRVGQESENLYIINLLLEEPLDQRIYEILVNRIKIFETNLGDLPDSLIEKLENGKSLDEDEIIRALREEDIRQRLLESDSLIGLDDALDEEIQVISRKKHGEINELRWLVFEYLINIMFGEKQIEKSKRENDQLTLKNIDETDIEALSKLIDIKNRVEVKEQLLDELTTDGILKISFNHSRIDGLYIPYLHPLMQKAVEISYNSIYGTVDPQKIESLSLFLKRTKVDTISHLPELLFLVEFDYCGKYVQKRKWTWFSLVDFNQKLCELDTQVLQDVWKGYMNGNVEVTSLLSNLNMPKGVSKQVQKRYDEWLERIRAEEKSHYICNTHAEIRRYNELLGMLLQLKKDSNLAGFEKIDSNIAETKMNLEQLKSRLAQINSGSMDFEDTSGNLRTVAVIKFE